MNVVRRHFCSRLAFARNYLAMSSTADSLEEIWLGGREGTLSPLESLKAFAFYTVYVEQGVSEKKVFAKVAEKVTKLGGGHPGSDAIRKFI